MYWLCICWDCTAGSHYTASCPLAMISLLGSVLEVIKKLRPFERRSVSIWVNYLEDILITHFFLSVILVALSVALFLLINKFSCMSLSCWFKRFLIRNWWCCHGRPSIFYHSRNLNAGLWMHCYNYDTVTSKSLGMIWWWRLFYL